MQQKETSNFSELTGHIQYLETLLAKNNIKYNSWKQKETTKLDGMLFNQIQTKKSKRVILGGYNKEFIEHYKRQMVLKEVCLEGQTKLLKSKILVIGAGGTGSTALLYLAGLGVGQIGIVDFDKVDISNLHRQIIHDQTRVGLNKAVSAKITLQAFNPSLKYEVYETNITNSNAEKLISGYDVIVDSTDNAISRYLINDTCCQLNKPLVSASALRWEGQLSVYNYNGGPCYRCVFPQCPDPNEVKACRQVGVIGMIPGIMGSLCAVEVLKIIVGMKDGVLAQKYLSYNAKNGKFRTCRIRGKQKGCVACDPTAEGYIKNIQEYNYSAFTKEALCIIPTEEDEFNISIEKFIKLYDQEDFDKHNLLLDTRSGPFVEIIKYKNSVHYSHEKIRILQNKVDFVICSDNLYQEQIEELLGINEKKPKMIYVTCTVGRSALLTTKFLRKMGIQSIPKSLFLKLLDCINIIGGMHGFSLKIETDMPVV